MTLTTSPPFKWIAPASGPVAGQGYGQGSILVFASPHSGQEIPADMAASETLSEADVNSACDVGMDQMVSRAPQGGVPLLTSLISRAYVDLNRSEGDLDPVLIADLPEDFVASAKARAGYGVVPRLSGLRLPLYERRLSVSEVEARLSSVYRPYHQALGEMMQTCREQKGRALLIDWHSMPQRATGQGGADVVLGDRYGTSCSVEVTRHLRGLFEALGWKVALNRPYAGGYATQTWGRPAEGFEAIQVELSRRLYWDEAGQRPSAGWRRCQTALNRVIDDLIRAYQA